MEFLAEYAAKIIYKAGSIHFAPDALSRIPTLNAVGKPQSLLEKVYQAQNTSSDQEFLGYKISVTNLHSEFLVNQGLIITLVENESLIIIPGDATQLKQTVFAELHTSPLRGTLGILKFQNWYARIFGGRTSPHRCRNSDVHVYCISKLKQ